MTLQRVGLTPAAEVLVRLLRQPHGPVMFQQSGGCCDQYAYWQHTHLTVDVVAGR